MFPTIFSFPADKTLLIINSLYFEKESNYGLWLYGLIEPMCRRKLNELIFQWELYKIYYLESMKKIYSKEIFQPIHLWEI